MVEVHPLLEAALSAIRKRAEKSPEKRKNMILGLTLRLQEHGLRCEHGCCKLVRDLIAELEKP